MASTSTPPETDDSAASGPGRPSGASSGSGSGGSAGSAGSPAPEQPLGPGAGFFGWLRSLGVPRAPGWIGGVCAGVGARLGIDPIIVRGVLVVFALFAPPAFLVYGVAWLLLPDLSGRIHLERLLQGVFDSAIVGIAAFLLIGLAPFAFGIPSFVQGVFGAVWSGSFRTGPWGTPFGFNVLPVLWTLLLVGGIVALVIWLVRRASGPQPGETGPEAAFAQYERADAASRAPSSATTATTATPTDPAASAAAVVATAVVADTAASDRAGDVAHVPPEAEGAAPASTAPLSAAALSDSPAAAEPAAPQQPGAGAGTDEYAEWRARYDAWRVEHERWKQDQAAAGRAARTQLAAENRARAAAFQAQAEAARLERRRTRPRTSFAYVIATLGAALVAGAVAASIALGGGSQAPYAAPIGLAVATIVGGLSMVLAGALRRRSGFLAFVTVVLLIGTIASAAVPRTSELVIGSFGGRLGSTTIMQPIGDVRVSLDDRVASVPGTPTARILQGAGAISVEVRDGARLQLDVECGSCSVSIARATGLSREYFDGTQLTAGPGSTSSWHRAIGAGLERGVPDATLEIRAGASRIEVVVFPTSR